MAEIGKHKLSDAIPDPQRVARPADEGGKPAPTHGTAAEQAREAAETAEGQRRPGVDSRDRMVDIGRGNQQAGRQGQ